MSKKGFTLIELLVVISIIAILLSILLPSLGKAKGLARKIICQSNLKQWGNCFILYTQDNDDKFHDETSKDGKYRLWQRVLRPYYNDVAEFRCCPVARRAITEIDPSISGTGSTAYGSHTAAWGKFQSSPFGEDGDYGSYGINGYVVNPPANTANMYGKPTRINWRTPLVKGAASVPLLLDAAWVDGRPYGDVPGSDQLEMPASREQAVDRNYAISKSINRFCVDRHNKMTNGVFLDMSVKTVKLSGLWKLKWHKEFDTAGVPESSVPNWMK